MYTQNEVALTPRTKLLWEGKEARLQLQRELTITPKQLKKIIQLNNKNRKEFIKELSRSTHASRH